MVCSQVDYSVTLTDSKFLDGLNRIDAIKGVIPIIDALEPRLSELMLVGLQFSRLQYLHHVREVGIYFH